MFNRVFTNPCTHFNQSARDTVFHLTFQALNGVHTCWELSLFSAAVPFFSISSLRASFSCWILDTLSWTFSTLPLPSVSTRKTRHTLSTDVPEIFKHISEWQTITSNMFFHLPSQLVLQRFHCVCTFAAICAWISRKLPWVIEGLTTLPNECNTHHSSHHIHNMFLFCNLL